MCLKNLDNLDKKWSNNVNMYKCRMKEGGALKSAQKCHILFEWPRTVAVVEVCFPIQFYVFP